MGVGNGGRNLLVIMCVRRIVVVDHKTNDVYLVALHAADDACASAGAAAWIGATSTAITAAQQPGSGQRSHSQPHKTCNGHAGSSQPAAADLDASSAATCTREPGEQDAGRQGPHSSAVSGKAPLFKLRHAREQYIQDVESALKVRRPSLLLTAVC